MLPSDKRIPQPAMVTALVMIAGTFTSWLFALVAHLLGRPKPYTWPYYEIWDSHETNKDIFQDLLGFVPTFHQFHTHRFFIVPGAPFTYPPATALVYRMFLPNLGRPVLAFLLFIFVVCGVAALFFALRLVKLGVAKTRAFAFVGCFFLFSSVFPFELNRLNMEIVVFALIAGYLWAFVNRKSDLAAVLLGGAIAMKMYPFILLGALVTAKKYRAVLLAIAVAVMVTVVGLYAETTSLSISLEGTQKGLQFFSDNYIMRNSLAFGWDHSDFAMIKRLSSHFTIKPDFPHLYRIYMVSVAIGSSVLYLTRIRKMPVLNQLMALVILSITIPPASFEYTLLHLFSIFALFTCWCIRDRGRTARMPLQIVGGCFGILFGVLGFTAVKSEVHDGAVKAMALFVLLCVVLIVPLAEPEQGSEPVQALPAAG